MQAPPGPGPPRREALAEQDPLAALAPPSPGAAGRRGEGLPSFLAGEAEGVAKGQRGAAMHLDPEVADDVRPPAPQVLEAPLGLRPEGRVVAVGEDELLGRCHALPRLELGIPLGRVGQR
eukprot:4493027-Lingulodinium_polyedra.AAC.1